MTKYGDCANEGSLAGGDVEREETQRHIKLSVLVEAAVVDVERHQRRPVVARVVGSHPYGVGTSHGLSGCSAPQRQQCNQSK